VQVSVVPLGNGQIYRGAGAEAEEAEADVDDAEDTGVTVQLLLTSVRLAIALERQLFVPVM
jgi:hypothetical protein